MLSSVFVVLIQKCNLLCSLGYNTGSLETVEAAEVLGCALTAMTCLRELA